MTIVPATTSDARRVRTPARMSSGATDFADVRAIGDKGRESFSFQQGGHEIHAVADLIDAVEQHEAAHHGAATVCRCLLPRACFQYSCSSTLKEMRFGP